MRPGSPSSTVLAPSPAKVRHGDQVVAAAVPDVGQRVVLCQEGNGWSVSRASLNGGTKGRLYSSHPALDQETISFQGVSQHPRRIVLLVVQLGMGMDVQADPHQLITTLVKGIGNHVAVGFASFSAHRSSVPTV